MPKKTEPQQQVYNVNISRTIYQGRVVQVVASSPEEAAEKAEERAPTHVYGYGSAGEDSFECNASDTRAVRPATTKDIKKDEEAGENDDFADLDDDTDLDGNEDEDEEG